MFFVDTVDTDNADDPERAFWVPRAGLQPMRGQLPGHTPLFSTREWTLAVIQVYVQSKYTRDSHQLWWDELLQCNQVEYKYCEVAAGCSVEAKREEVGRMRWLLPHTLHTAQNTFNTQHRTHRTHSTHRLHTADAPNCTAINIFTHTNNSFHQHINTRTCAQKYLNSGKNTLEFLQIFCI